MAFSYVGNNQPFLMKSSLFDKVTDPFNIKDKLRSDGGNPNLIGLYDNPFESKSKPAPVATNRPLPTNYTSSRTIGGGMVNVGGTSNNNSTPVVTGLGSGRASSSSGGSSGGSSSSSIRSSGSSSVGGGAGGGISAKVPNIQAQNQGQFNQTYEDITAQNKKLEEMMAEINNQTMNANANTLQYRGDLQNLGSKIANNDYGDTAYAGLGEGYSDELFNNLYNERMQPLLNKANALGAAGSGAELALRGNMMTDLQNESELRKLEELQLLNQTMGLAPTDQWQAQEPLSVDYMSQLSPFFNAQTSAQGLASDNYFKQIAANLENEKWLNELEQQEFMKDQFKKTSSPASNNLKNDPLQNYNQIISMLEQYTPVAYKLAKDTGQDLSQVRKKGIETRAAQLYNLLYGNGQEIYGDQSYAAWNSMTRGLTELGVEASRNKSVKKKNDDSTGYGDPDSTGSTGVGALGGGGE